MTFLNKCDELERPIVAEFYQRSFGAGASGIVGECRAELIHSPHAGRTTMSSNFKPKSASKESPTEPFKRAVTGCLRAIARKPDLEVAFAAERPGVAGNKVRLPEPPRKLNRQEAAIVRGHADALALKLACHDPAVHRKLVPGGQQARAVFDAVEQARVEAIGSRRMTGVATQPVRHASTTVSTAASSTRSPTAPMRRSRMPSR